MKSIIRSSALIVFCILIAAGCKGNRGVRTGVPAELGANGLEELAGVYKYLAQNKEPAPKKLEDLAEREAALPTAWAKLQSGEYVVAWGAGYSSSGGGAVLAYEKNVPDSGGLVLMQDGTVKEMTAAQFKTAPKAR